MVQKDPLDSADLYRFGKNSTNGEKLPSYHHEGIDDQPVNINIHCEIQEPESKSRRSGGLFFGLIGSILDIIVGTFYLIFALIFILCVIDSFF